MSHKTALVQRKNKKKSFLKILLFFLFFMGVHGYTQDLKLGIRVQKTVKMYWENGISVQYSFKKLKPNQLYFGFDYVTSRIGTAFKSNAIKHDHFLLTGSWLFNKNKPYHLLTRFNVGYFYADLENDIFNKIPNKSFLLSPEIGFTYDLKPIPISLNMGAGFYIITAKNGYSPGTLQPLYYHFDIYFKIFKPKKNE